MARIVVTGPIGELSGKLGGQVFARNKAGYYVRANAIGTDPNSDAQIRARTKFGMSSSQYHSLTSVQKVAWQNFATNDFVPKGGTVPGTLSGFNAFVSMRNVVLNADELNSQPTTITINALPVTPTYVPFSTVNDAPASMLQNGLVDDSNVSFGVEISSASALSTDGLLSSGSVVLNALGTVSPPTITTTVGRLTSGNTNVGFALYASKGQQQEAMFVENEEERILSFIPHMEFGAPKTFTNVTIPFALAQDPTKYQQLPQQDEFVRLSLYLVSSDGMMTKIGAKIVQIA